MMRPSRNGVSRQRQHILEVLQVRHEGMQIAFQYCFSALGQSQQVMPARPRRGLPVLRPGRRRALDRKIATTASAPAPVSGRRSVPAGSRRERHGSSARADIRNRGTGPARSAPACWSRSAGIAANALMTAASVTAFEAEVMGSRRLPAMPPLAKQRNQVLPAGIPHDGPNIPTSQGRPWRKPADIIRCTGVGQIPYLGMPRQTNCRTFSGRLRSRLARATAVNPLFFPDDFGEDCAQE